MNFIAHAPNLKISQNDEYVFSINTVQIFEEDESTVILKCAEIVPKFKRGFVCDISCIYNITNTYNHDMGKKIETIKDLVLVYINKRSSNDRFTEFEYIFYK